MANDVKKKIPLMIKGNAEKDTDALYQWKDSSQPNFFGAATAIMTIMMMMDSYVDDDANDKFRYD